jgi:hypothetical protein
MVMMAGTSPSAPYNALRPVRCRHRVDGSFCNEPGQNIDWEKAQTVDWRCKRCKGPNVVYIPEVARVDSAGPI